MEARAREDLARRAGLAAGVSLRIGTGESTLRGQVPPHRLRGRGRGTEEQDSTARRPRYQRRLPAESLSRSLQPQEEPAMNPTHRLQQLSEGDA
jgi:hypothetical protein